MTIKLIDNNLRCFSFPFDWIRICSMKDVCDLFEQDFLDFLNPEYLEFKNLELDKDFIFPKKKFIFNKKHSIAFNDLHNSFEFK